MEGEPPHAQYNATEPDIYLRGVHAAMLYFVCFNGPLQMPSGSLSPYGGELHALLRYMSQPAQQQQLASKSPLDGASWATALAGYFQDVYAGYKNKSVKTLIANIEAGKQYPATGDAEDTQANSLCKVCKRANQVGFAWPFFIARKVEEEIASPSWLAAVTTLCPAAAAAAAVLCSCR
jgi:hypothetical protein